MWTRPPVKLGQLCAPSGDDVDASPSQAGAALRTDGDDVTSPPVSASRTVPSSQEIRLRNIPLKSPGAGRRVSAGVFLRRNQKTPPAGLAPRGLQFGSVAVAAFGAVPWSVISQAWRILLRWLCGCGVGVALAVERRHCSLVDCWFFVVVRDPCARFEPGAFGACDLAQRGFGLRSEACEYGSEHPAGWACGLRFGTASAVSVCGIGSVPWCAYRARIDRSIGPWVSAMKSSSNMGRPCCASETAWT